MSEIKINKIQVAERHINAGIWMLFRNDDPVVVHTVVMAGFRVLRDLVERKGLKHDLDTIIRPGKRPEFWHEFNRFTNFYKHADRDPYAVSEGFREETNDPLLMVSVRCYQLLGYQWTKEMQVLWSWYCVLHPDILSDSGDMVAVKAALVSASRSTRSLRRTDELAVGLQMLKHHTGVDTPAQRVRSWAE